MTVSRTTAAGVLLAVAGIAAAGCASPPSTSPVGHTSATHQPATPAGPPNADPSGTATGSCDYTLGYPGLNHLVGEVDERNTGNVGIRVRVTITWPQEGTRPVRVHRTVKVAKGAMVVARFRKAVDGTVIDQLQSWQERHSNSDGCTYKSVMVSTFGQPSR